MLPVLSDKHIEKLFLFSLMWSLGAVLELDGRAALQEFLVNHKSNCDWPKCKEDETIFEFLVSPSGDWIHWNERVPVFIYPTDSVLEYHSILVPNVDNTRTLYLIDLIANQEKAVLLIGMFSSIIIIIIIIIISWKTGIVHIIYEHVTGEQGTGKTVMIKGSMAKHDPEVHLNKSFNFSSASTPNMVQVKK